MEKNDRNMLTLGYLKEASYSALDKFVAFVTAQDAKSSRRVKAFVDAMNAKASSIGVNNSHFSDPSGFVSKDSRSTASDIATVFSHVMADPKIAAVLEKNTGEMSIAGRARRTRVIESTVCRDLFTDSDFRILAGKTGTSPCNAYNVAFIARASDDSLFLCSLLGSDSEENRWKDSLASLTCAYDRRRGIDTKALDVTAKSVSVRTYPEGEEVVSKNPDESVAPASLTKLMAALTASEYLTDWDVKVRVQRNDLTKGSGNNLRFGDYVTVRDLFYDMLIPSSNTAAHVLARLAGKELDK